MLDTNLLRHHCRLVLFYPTTLHLCWIDQTIKLGYHRLWSHRSYNASLPLQLFLLAGGTSAVQGSCYWWARSHRSHHRHTDTDLDPYNANRGLFWTHVGWMIFKSGLRSGASDVLDLKHDALLQWQHRHYFSLLVLFGYLLPTLIPGLLFDDWAGGLCFSGALRLTIAHHVRVQLVRLRCSSFRIADVDSTYRAPSA